MKKIFVPIILIFILLPFSVNAQTYYVDATGGDDSYNGLYPTFQGGSDGPWQTLNKVQTTLTGDQSDTIVNFKRGEQWNETYDVAGYGTPGHPFVHSNYGSGNLPLINGIEEKSGWIQEGGLWYIEGYQYGPPSVVRDGEFCNKETNKVDLDATDEYWYDNPNDRVYIYGSPSGQTLLVSARINLFDTMDHDYLTFDGIAFEGAGGSSIRIMSGSNNISIINCTAKWPSGTAFNFWGGTGHLMDGVEVSYSGVGWGDLSGVTGTFRNSYIHHCTAQGIGLFGVWILEHSEIAYCGKALGQEHGNYTGASDPGSIMRYLYDHHSSGNGINIGPDYLIHNCISTYNGNHGFSSHSNHTGIRLWNNVGAFNSESGLNVAADSIVAEAYNNIFAENGQWQIRVWGATATLTDSDYNLFWRNGTLPVWKLNRDDPNEYDFNEWQSAGYDANSIFADPAFVNAGGSYLLDTDFQLQNGSLAIDNGVGVGLTQDYEGNPIPSGNGTDIGAYEYVSVSGPTYYVDSNIGNDANNCSQALDPSTPKRTVNSIMSCNPGAGDIVKFRGTFTQGIYPTRSGEVLYAFQPIQGVSGSTVTFSNSMSGLNPATDYVTIYNSRKGNSGAFAVVSFSGNSVTVDTSDLPLGSFISETAADPGDLHAAILRPVHFTAWDKNNPPVFDPYYQTFHSNCMSVVMVSYLHSISGENHQVWPAFELDCSDLTPSDYIILDHIEIENAATAIATEAHHFQSNYDIIQHNNIHNVGYQGLASDEGIYFGYDIRLPVEYHDYVQIMYNKVGPHRFTTGVIGDGIEIKESARYATVFGNEVFGIQCLYCADAPIRVSGIDAFVANNFVHDISPGESRGCGISIVDDYPSEPTTGGKRAIVVNNILANVRGMGIRVLDANGVQILHNTIYNIPYPEPNGDPAWYEEYAGIFVQNWQGPTENITIKINIVHSAHIGIGRYIWSHDYPVSIDSDYNIVFNTTYPFRGDTDSRGTITQNTNDLLLDPMFVNPSGGNFHLQSSSPAIDNGTALSDVAIDFDSIPRP
ncbi:MAG: right-handed parallel beta-helix repeat-containing protein, partial [Candidatus Aenigmatarchaeota archaeon]